MPRFSGSTVTTDCKTRRRRRGCSPPLLSAAIFGSVLLAGTSASLGTVAPDARPASRPQLVIEPYDRHLRSGQIEIVVVSHGAKGALSSAPFIAGGGVPFTDCAQGEACPEMIVVPSSPPGFAIGSVDAEVGHQLDERRQEVTIKAFAIGRSEVSVAQYMRCVEAGACRPPEWLETLGGHKGLDQDYAGLKAEGGAGNLPIVGVGYADAVAYSDWLSATTGHRYRLPSEAEWEYAARAGAASAYWWGNEARKDQKIWANCLGCGSEWDGRALAPVDGLAPNPWGLFHVHGNALEWVADYYCASYAAGPTDGTPRMTDDCSVRDAPGLRVLRGGSAFHDPRLMRAAARLRSKPDLRSVSAGFRVARDIAFPP